MYEGELMENKSLKDGLRLIDFKNILPKIIILPNLIGPNRNTFQGNFIILKLFLTKMGMKAD